ncbi:hypothetical protein D3C75_865860 [compost metagenome]
MRPRKALSGLQHLLAFGQRLGSQLVFPGPPARDMRQTVSRKTREGPGCGHHLVDPDGVLPLVIHGDVPFQHIIFPGRLVADFHTQRVMGISQTENQMMISNDFVTLIP